jgi:hypothetical protein
MKWLESYDERQLALLDMCRAYAERHPKAGAPGHNLYLLVASMAAQLDGCEQAGADIPQIALPPGEPATEKQVRFMYFTGSKERGWDEGQVEQACAQVYGGRKPANLTKTEASAFIDMLKQKQA